MIPGIIKNISLKALILILGGAIGWVTTFTACKKNLRITRIDGMDEKCNIMYTVMDLYSNAKDKGIVPSAIEKCGKALDIEYCEKKVYDNNMTLRYKNLKLKDWYNQCLKERQ